MLTGISCVKKAVEKKTHACIVLFTFLDRILSLPQVFFLCMSLFLTISFFLFCSINRSLITIKKKRGLFDRCDAPRASAPTDKTWANRQAVASFLGAFGFLCLKKILSDFVNELKSSTVCDLINELFVVECAMDEEKRGDLFDLEFEPKYNSV